MASSWPTLAEIGHILWGPNWAEPLAEMLNLTKEDVVALDAHPDNIPAGLYEQMIVLCRVRIHEIGTMLERLNAGEPSTAIDNIGRMAGPSHG
jgi:hypothetical protein